MRKRTQQHGFTMLELMIVVAILGVLAVVAAPSFNSSINDRQLAEAVEAIYSDMRYARSESIKRSQNTKITFTDDASWSYTIVSLNPDGSVDETIKTVSNTQFSVATVVSDFDNDVITFDSIRGTATEGTTPVLIDDTDHELTITTDDGSEGTVTVSAIGRVSSDY